MKDKNLGAVSYAVLIIATLIGLMLYSCARADDWAVRIMDETHKRVEVRSYWGRSGNYYANTYQAVENGFIWGNCTDFAATAEKLLKDEGRPASIIQCGRRHVVAMSGPWIFDSNSQKPLRLGESGCF